MMRKSTCISETANKAGEKSSIGSIAMVLIASILGMGLISCTSLPRESLTAQSSIATNQERSLKLPETIKLKTQDGWTLIGDLYRPLGVSRGAIILLHQRGGSAKDYQPLATALQRTGFTALAIDQRGSGRSTLGPAASGDDAPWLTTEDIAAAVASLSTERLIGLIGASYGANNALIYAAAHPQQIRGVALFSPGANYNGLDAIAAARLYRGSIIIYHSKDDSIAGQGPEQINQISPSVKHKLQIVNGNAHGTDLISPEVTLDVINFFQDSFRN